MKKLLSILSITAIICSLSLSQAIAMEAKSGDMKSDKTMMDNGMKKDGAMGKDHKMMDDGMKKDGMMKDKGMKKCSSQAAGGERGLCLGPAFHR